MDIGPKLDFKYLSLIFCYLSLLGPTQRSHSSFNVALGNGGGGGRGIGEGNSQ